MCVGLGLAAHRDDLVAELRHEVDRDRADAAGSARHHDRPQRRLLPVLLHAMDREPGGESRSAERHRVEMAHAVGQRNDGIARGARVFRITAVERLGMAAARDQDLLPGLEARVGGAHDFSREVDAAIQRVLPQDLAGARCRERVLVVDARVLHADDDVAGRQRVDRHLLEARDDLALALVNAECLE